MSDKFWNFSRSERIAAIVLSIMVALGIAISIFLNNRQNISTKNYQTEIEEFKSRIVEKAKDDKPIKKTRKRKANKTYTPQRQTLTPIK